MERTRFLVRAIWVILCSTGLVSTVRATITPDGNVVPTTDPTSWTSSTTAYVGQTGNGNLRVDSNSDLQSRTAYIGYDTGVVGAVTIDGSGSTWTNVGLYVGNYGSGTLNVSGSGAVTNTYNAYGCIGRWSGSTGVVTIHGAGSTWTGSWDLAVGDYGSGTLNVTNRGTVSSAIGHIGRQSGSIGTMTVDGVGSNWTNDFDAYVGDSGNGTLNVTRAATASVKYGHIGYSSGSTGVVTVDGADSTWTNTWGLAVGESGNGTLNVAHGGSVTSVWENNIGYLAGSIGEATVDGDGSTWTTTSDLYVGNYGHGTLNLTNRAAVVAGGTTYVADKPGSTGSIRFGADGGTLTTRSLLASLGQLSGTGTVDAHGLVSDVDLTFDANDSLTQALTLNGQVGQNVTVNLSLNGFGALGAGYEESGSLAIRNGVVVPSSYGYLGYQSGSTGVATVDGPGSTWHNYVDLHVGHSGAGVLRITNGAAVVVDDTTYVATNTGSTGTIDFGTGGGTLTTTSLMASPSQLRGTGTITTHGLVSDLDLVFDDDHGVDRTFTFDTQSGQNVTVVLKMGNASTNGALGAGYQGSGTLTIRDTGITSNGGYIGYKAGSTGVATVDGRNWTSGWTDVVSKLHYSDLYVGKSGSGTLDVSGGGDVCNRSGYVGDASGSTGVVTVDGPGSTWTNKSNWGDPGSSDLYVGNSGTGTLRVTRGGLVTNGVGRIGYESGSVGAVLVDGAGSEWTNSLVLRVGDSGTGTLDVAGGGAVSSSSGYIGYSSGSTGAVTVDGAGSKWTNCSDIFLDNSSVYVGNAGNGTLSITGGGTVTNVHGYIGYSAGSTGVVTVDGAGSKWTNRSGSSSIDPDLYVGHSGTGALNITGGGTVENLRGYVGYSAGATGVVTVDGAGSEWVNRSDLTVGRSGTGTMNVTGGGIVGNTSGYIGSSSGSTGVVTVDGTGSRWINTSALCVGGSGAATLNVTHGGAVGSSTLSVGSKGNSALRIASGGTVSDVSGYIAPDLSSTGMVSVTGTASRWSNSGDIFIGGRPYFPPFYGGAGTLNIADGGMVSATNVSVNGQSMLAIVVDNGSLLTVGEGGGTITNNGIVRILAGANAESAVYSPIFAATITNDGAWQAVGGTWDANSGQFTVSAAAKGSSGMEISGINLASTQRALVGAGGDWSVGASFLASSSTIDFTATAIDGAILSDLQTRAAGQSVLSGWGFLTDNYAVNSDNPVYLSLKVGSGWSADDLSLWRYADGEWSAYTASDLTYDGTYASFTVTTFSSYAATGVLVPEPSAIALVVVGVISLLAYAWRQRQQMT